MRLAFHTLDVFTETRFAGNPLAVVLEADSLETAAMQTIAREFNLSETVFVLKPDSSTHSARIRIFTPGAEMPFAGHPTVGTAILLSTLRTPEADRGRDAMVVLEENIGLVRVGVRLVAGSAPFAEFDAPRLPEQHGNPPPDDLLAAVFDLMPREIGFENHKPLCLGAGNSFVFVPVASLEAIAKARLDAAQWTRMFAGGPITGAFLYTRQCVRTTSAFHARMFAAPESGVGEDPATGSAAVAFAGAIARFDEPRQGWHRRDIEQGFEMGRPSLIFLSFEMEHAKLSTVRIGGHAVPVSSGTIEL